MPDSTHVTLTPAEVVGAFYGALIDQDPERLGELADAGFDDAIFVEMPSSLPYGGRVEGARRLRAMFQAMARGVVDVGPRGLTLDALVDGGDRIAARLSFDWYPPGGGAPIASGAVEEWTFENGKAIAIRAYYRDTAELLAAPATAADGA
ncbi:nuclear transport factor 2 family protein [Rhodococcus sp. T7]|uniref:nuclear transport factor 2 family protein n=1 Tax=Rhodococcus sp. T7 TaxID=627444 RepID=UPI00135B4213|nr:nuclear transport factor 2 family protein [Rhodococcus sp. T7]KAF0956955.1 hypothetical protein MLGJGCBP_10035 [Rhodococcus sp. T7]KAF0963350.1 hypothetical protein MLGJGCBP_03521 [Rhodococcus sp. T7]